MRNLYLWIALCIGSFVLFSLAEQIGTWAPGFQVTWDVVPRAAFLLGGFFFLGYKAGSDA